jgi:hypothetical protein
VALRLTLAGDLPFDTVVLAIPDIGSRPLFLSPHQRSHGRQDYPRNMAGRRFLLLVAVLMGLTALAASVAPRDPSLRDRADRGRQATPTPAPRAEPASPSITEREETLSADEPSRRVIVERGELIRLEVSADEIDTVTIDGLDAVDTVDPESPAVFDLLADRPGSYPIELLEDERRIGTLVVRD